MSRYSFPGAGGLTMEGYSTLKEVGKTRHLSVGTLRRYLRQGRLQGIKRYRRER